MQVNVNNEMRNQSNMNRDKQGCDRSVALFKSAQNLYREQARKAKWRRIFCLLSGRRHTLPILSETLKPYQALHMFDSGIQAVPLCCICGSESRSQDFDPWFHPLTEKNRERWVRIANLCLRGHPFPAVQLIRVGGEYYVRDGHHRVSVMQALGYKFIDASVTVLDTMPSGMECAPVC